MKFFLYIRLNFLKKGIFMGAEIENRKIWCTMAQMGFARKLYNLTDYKEWRTEQYILKQIIDEGIYYESQRMRLNDMRKHYLNNKLIKLRNENKNKKL